MDSKILLGLIETADAILKLLKKVDPGELQKAIDSAKSSGGDTSDLERVLNG